MHPGHPATPMQSSTHTGGPATPMQSAQHVPMQTPLPTQLRLDGGVVPIAPVRNDAGVSGPRNDAGAGGPPRNDAGTPPPGLVRDGGFR